MDFARLFHTDPVVRLPALLDARGGAWVGRTLEAQLATARPLVLDGGGVRWVDSAGLRPILVSALVARCRGQPLAWSRASTALTDAAREAGLGDALGLEEPASR